MKGCELRAEEDFRKIGYRVMAFDFSVSEAAKQSGIDVAVVLMRAGRTYVAYRYTKSGIYSQPSPVQ